MTGKNKKPLDKTRARNSAMIVLTMLGTLIFGGTDSMASLGTFILGGPDSDILADSGRGDDFVYTGDGNDMAIYTPSENLMSIDYFDGGKGFDILHLRLTKQEYEHPQFQADHLRLQFFLLHTMNPHSASDEGPSFDFESFNLKVRNFEILELEIIEKKEAAVVKNLKL